MRATYHITKRKYENDKVPKVDVIGVVNDQCIYKMTVYTTFKVGRFPQLVKFGSPVRQYPGSV